LILAVAVMGFLGYFVTRNVLQPLKKLTKAGQRMAKGDLDCEVYRGTIDANTIRKSDELGQLVLAFESMRRRLLYLDNDLTRLNKEKTAALERVCNTLAEQERELRSANARMAGQSDELKLINEGLSARNQELSDAYSKLQTLDKVKSEFIMIAAHELRTPIQPIIGFVELAERGSVSAEEAWKIIGSEARRLASLSADLLDVGKIESGTFTYDMKSISVKQVIDGLLASSAKFATPDGIVSIKTDFDSDVRIRGDRSRLIQALENIVNNAVKFGKNGTISIQTNNDYERGLVELRIADNGPGIPAEILPVVFEKFVTKTEANQRGTGLGLYITRAIIEAHNGKIRAENNIEHGGKGASFIISMPICDPNMSLKYRPQTPALPV
jgi:signal transduction histidine kinase